MRDLPNDRRLAILAVCATEWLSMLADDVVETHDRIVGKLYRSSQRLCEAKITDEKDAVRDTLKSFAELGGALVGAQDDGASLEEVIAVKPGWEGFRSLVATAVGLTSTMTAEPLSHMLDGYSQFRRYAPRMLSLLKMQAAPVAAPLLIAVSILRNSTKGERSTDFLRPGSKWRRHLRAQPDGDFRLWEVAVLFHLRDAFRSGDLWLARSCRYGDIKQTRVLAQAVTQTARLAVPLRPRNGCQGDDRSSMCG